MESWKSIPGYEGHYEVSDMGRVRSLDRTILIDDPRVGVFERTVAGRVLSAKVAKGGYLRVNLALRGKVTTRSVHQLVMLAFVGQPPTDSECCHGNGNPADNRLANLRYDTRYGNYRDKIRHRGVPRKLTDQQILEIRERYASGAATQVQMGEEYGVSHVAVGAVLRGVSWVHVQPI